MEEHLVNTSASGAKAVIAVLLKVGAHNNALDPILNAALAHLETDNSSTTISSSINFAGLMPTNLKGWYFEGSLTTPLLSQPVYWFVLKTPITLDANQLAEYKTVATDGGFLPNARPVQPQDGRQFYEIDNDVNFQNNSVMNVNFVIAPRHEPGGTSLIGSAITPRGAVASARDEVGLNLVRPSWNDSFGPTS